MNQSTQPHPSLLHAHREVLLFAFLAAFGFSATAQTYATGDPRNPKSEPAYPGVCQTLTAQFKTSQRSSPPTSDDTSRIQTALNNCAGKGTSVVLESNGTENAFYSAMLTVNGAGLVVDSGTTLEGNNSYSSQAELILIEGKNSFLGGTGAIDGRGDLISGTPRLVQTSSASELNIDDITLQQAAHPNLYLQGGSDVTVWGITILTPATRANADGIDIDSISDVTVANAQVEAGDDGIAIKTNASSASNITVKNSKFYGTHGLSIGSQTFDGVTNVLFSGNYVYGVDHNGNASGDANAINIKTDPDCGGLVKQVTYQNTCMTQAKHLIVVNAQYGSCNGTKGTPQFQNIVIDGAFSQDSVSSAYSEIAGYNSNNLAQVYVGNIKLDNNAQKGDTNAKIDLNNVSGWAPSGSNVSTGTWTPSGSGVPSCSF